MKCDHLSEVVCATRCNVHLTPCIIVIYCFVVPLERILCCLMYMCEEILRHSEPRSALKGCVPELLISLALDIHVPLKMSDNGT